ncbi:MAG: TlyA family rRNA (cytidine-2'-O)-methyltransferase [Candidatus Abyssubacteria bacterium]
MKVTSDKRERLDKLMVDLNLAPSRARARALILAGRVRVDSRVADKAGAVVKPGSRVELLEGAEYVSRGGEKLEHAVRHFNLVIQDKVALDVGASTGGFTECLLRHGARKVYAVDVGYGQLAWQLRTDPRVVVMERTNARTLAPSLFQERPQLATVDVSFISLALVLPPVAHVLADRGEIIALIKPQFEAGREKVGKGGVVRDPAVHAEVIDKIVALTEDIEFDSRGVIESPILGPAGNKEFLIYLIRRGS